MNSATFWIGLACSLGLHVGVSLVAIYPWGGFGQKEPLELSLVTIEVPSEAGDGVEETAKTEKSVPVIRRALVKKASVVSQKVSESASAEAMMPVTEESNEEAGGEPIKAAVYGIHPDYPRYSRRHGQMGTVIYKATFLHDGSLGEATLEKSSGFSLLDEAALKALQDARVPQIEGSRRLAFRFVLSD